MHTADPGFRATVAALFAGPGFIHDLGVRFVDCGPGWCVTRLDVEPRHLQHTGVVHAGVCATMGDHSAGGATQTLYAADQVPLTVEFKIHLLRAARGTFLECRGEVLKPGSRFTTAESTVTAVDGARRTVVAKLTATLAPA